ncbi:MAG: ATP phosphoribosyltransferase [Candidatus Margulisiibacteriota bacterium]
MITIAIAKGYLYNEAVNLFEKLGYHFPDNDERQLYVDEAQGRLRLLRIRPWDVTVYVSQGAADLGVVGKDVLLEKPEEPVIQLLDLKFGNCSLVLAGPNPMNADQLTHNLHVATKYPHCTEAYFRKRGLSVNLIKLYGAVELGPHTGLSDLICDLTATGRTLKENHLHIIDTVFSSTAHLVANPVSFKTEHKAILELVARLSTVVPA